MTEDERLHVSIEKFRARLADQGIRGFELEVAVNAYAYANTKFRRYDVHLRTHVSDIEVPHIQRQPLVNLGRRAYRLARQFRGWFLAEQLAHHGAGLISEGVRPDAVVKVLESSWSLLVGKRFDEKGVTLATLTRKYAGLGGKA